MAEHRRGAGTATVAHGKRAEAWFGPHPLATTEDDNETRIVDAARRCVLQLGSARVGMRDIADAAGLSRATVYKHFSERDTLVVQAVPRKALQYLLADVGDALDGSDDLAGKFGNAAVVLQVWSTASRGLFHLRSDAENALVYSHTVAAAIDGIAELVLPTIVAARERGELRGELDPEQAAEWVARILQGVASLPQSRTFDMTSPESLSDFIRAFVVAGLR